MRWIEKASAVNWSLFVVMFLAMATWESLRPARPLSWPAERRWGTHTALLAISGIAMTLTYRITPVLLAVSVTNSRMGILNRAWMPFLFRCAATVLVLDLVNYATHRAFHSVPLLWRVHAVHHSDPDYDVSTAARFHPMEVIGVQGAHLAAILLLAPPPVAVFIAGLVTAVFNLFAHANASLPGWAEHALRKIFVTPGLHRIHHSEDVWEQSRNLGQTFAWWDRMFGTYASRSRQEGTKTGLVGLQNAESIGLGFILAEPFHGRSDVEPVSAKPGV